MCVILYTKGKQMSTKKELKIQEILKRVGQIIGSSKQIDVCRALEVNSASPGNAYNSWVARNTIPIQPLYRFASQHDIHLCWLLHGEGRKWIKEEVDKSRYLTEETFEKIGDPLALIIHAANTGTRELFFKLIRQIGQEESDNVQSGNDT